MQMRTAEVDILLSVYNGERFLLELLESLAAQTFKNFRLVVRDDGSTDSSLQIVERFAKDAPFETVFPEIEGRFGAMGSFGKLMQVSSAPYVMFCDQDDVWLPEKVAKELDAIKILEAELGPGVPALVHCDLKVVDASLNPIAGSMWKAQGLDALHRSRLPQALVQNSAVGCAMIANRALVEAASPIPPEARMHDAHLFIAAAALGGVKPLDEQLALYRQHGSNAVGFKDLSSIRALFGKAVAAKRSIDGTFKQAEAIGRSLQGLSPEACAVFEDFASIPARGWLARRLALIRGGFLKSGLLRNLGLLLLA